ncbi:hypothetical protein PV08_04301 [Exophiala spinifera]|uniref:Uncharacterized protein n=1 Tax=Exophiala spinifera TaxID=91928 RepID=A0A0D2BES7_9EURO|nr:uncharacterized protein PV08_04301 [Exophiala spinifera]KIW17110.1 hypothetical protein PV08_04301 [Exophiala spinifera]
MDEMAKPFETLSQVSDRHLSAMDTRRILSSSTDDQLQAASTSPSQTADTRSDGSFTSSASTSGTSTLYSSFTDVQLTKSESTTSDANNDGPLKLNEVLDHRLSMILESEPIANSTSYDKSKQVANEFSAAYKSRFNFNCAFRFTGSVDEPEAPPKTKGAFLKALIAEMGLAANVQAGLQAYQHALNSRKHHVFEPDFLIDQNTATIITIDQLDQIVAHLKEAKEGVDKIELDDAGIPDELFEAFCHAQLWVARTRAILVQLHVFYKINFVLPDLLPPPPPTHLYPPTPTTMADEATKAKLRAAFDKLTPEDFASVAGNKDALADKVAEKYSISKEEALKQVNEAFAK